MNLEYVDYCSLLPEDSNDDPSEDSRKGKFILITNGSNRWVVFSPKGLSVYHANIVDRFCSQNNIPGDYNPARTKFDIHDSQWNIMGGGKWEVNKEKTEMVIFGSSDAYGGVDLKQLAIQLKEKGIFENVLAC